MNTMDTRIHSLCNYYFTVLRMYVPRILKFALQPEGQRFLKLITNNYIKKQLYNYNDSYYCSKWKDWQR